MERSQGKKKSKFPADTNVDPGSYFDFVIAGVNYRILDTDFYAAIGVTGTIVQDGALTGVPILDVQGAVNNIRNLEISTTSGLQGAVSAENGITLALDAQSSGSGVKVLTDLNKIRRILAGSGIAVAAAGDDITVSTSAVPGPTNIVVVNDITDLPAAVASVIPLAADTVYYINTQVSVAGNSISVEDGTVITGIDPETSRLTSTRGAGNFIINTGNSQTVEISNISMDVAGMVAFFSAGSDSTSRLYVHNVVIIDCGYGFSTASFDKFRTEQIIIDACTSDPFIFSSHTNSVDIQHIQIAGFTGDAINLVTATFDFFSASFMQINSTAGANNILEGLLSSGGNIAAGGHGSVDNVIVTGSFTASTKILPTDLKWNFSNNTFIADSHPGVAHYMDANATETVIAIAGTPVLAAGTWAADAASKFSGTAAGRATYLDSPNARVQVVVSLMMKVSSGTETISAYLAKNGSIIANTKQSNDIASSLFFTTFVIPWTVDLATNDYLEVFVSNDTTTDNILVQSGIFRVG